MNESHILDEGTRARVTDNAERRIVGSDITVLVTTSDVLTVLEHVPDFGEYRMAFGVLEVWVDDEEAVALPLQRGLTEVPPFEPGHGRTDLEQLHEVIRLIDVMGYGVEDVREHVAQYLVGRHEGGRRGAMPGDRCQLIGDYKVRHVEPCSDGHATGVVTDVRTGKIVERP